MEVSLLYYTVYPPLYDFFKKKISLYANFAYQVWTVFIFRRDLLPISLKDNTVYVDLANSNSIQWIATFKNVFRLISSHCVGRYCIVTCSIGITSHGLRAKTVTLSDTTFDIARRLTINLGTSIEMNTHNIPVYAYYRSKFFGLLRWDTSPYLYMPLWDIARRINEWMHVGWQLIENSRPKTKLMDYWFCIEPEACLFRVVWKFVIFT